MDVGSEDEVPTVNADKKTKVEPQPDSEQQESADLDDGNEQTVEAAEDAYLNEWTKQWNENVDENKRKESGVSSYCKPPPPPHNYLFVEHVAKIMRRETAS
jgi:hypothetical protein